jgi:hypothetical protein
MTERRDGQTTLALLETAGAMEIDTDRIDKAVLVLFYPSLYDGCRAWKGRNNEDG